MTYCHSIVPLSELLIVTRGGERGLRTCAHSARSESLRRRLTVLADRYQAAVAELRDLLDRLGGDPGIRCVIPGALSRGWVNLQTAVTPGDDGVLVDECERAEDHALEVYRNALDDHLPEFVRQVVLRQFEDLMNDRQIRLLSGEPRAGGAVVASYGDHVQQ